MKFSFTNKKNLLKKIGSISRTYFLKSFTNQAFDGNKWKEVNRRISGTAEYNYPKKKKLSRRNSPILVRTGALRRAVAGAKITTTENSVSVKVDDATKGASYGKFHNSGDTRNKIKRQFMGASKQLANEIRKILTNETKIKLLRK